MSSRLFWGLSLGLFFVLGCSSSPPEPEIGELAAADPIPTELGDVPSDPPPVKPLPDTPSTPEAAGKTSSSILDDLDTPKLSEEDLEKKSVDELIQLAQDEFDPAEQVRILDAALKKDPRNQIVLTMAMSVTQNEGMSTLQTNQKASYPKFEQSAVYAKTLADNYDNFNDQVRTLLATALYNGACAKALSGKTDEAMAYLTSAVDQGFADPIFETDTDIDSLRDQPGFDELQAKVEKTRRGPSPDEMLADFQPFDFDFSLTDLEGNTVSLDSLKGKVVLVDFWGTWCPPCRAEIPHFIEMLDKYGDKGLAVVGITYENMPEDEAKPVIQAFVKENKINYPCVIGDEETMNQVPDFNAFPTTLFIDRAGKVRHKQVGFAQSFVPQMDAIVQKLLEEKGPEEKAPDA